MGGRRISARRRCVRGGAGGALWRGGGVGVGMLEMQDLQLFVYELITSDIVN